MEHMTRDATGHDSHPSHDAHTGQAPHAGHGPQDGPDSHGGHDKHVGHDPEKFRRRFWLTLAMTVPVVFTSEMVMDWFGYHLDGVAWVGPVLGSVIYLWGGQPFLVSAKAEIRDQAPGMMLLIAMAITVAWGASMASTAGWLDLEFWWELAALVAIMLLGHWQEMKAIGQARGALAALAELLPWLTRGGGRGGGTRSGWHTREQHLGCHEVSKIMQSKRSQSGVPPRSVGERFEPNDCRDDGW